MQPTENFNIPRRALDVEDYIDILRRHKGWVFGPFLLTLVASVVGVYLWPDSYESVAVVKIVPQQVPENMVQSSITQDMTDRINSMATTVLSRNVLTTMINNFDLYPKDRKRLPTDDVVEIMRKAVQITPVIAGSNGRNVPAFSVQFSYENRMLANKVVSDVVNRFISENISNRSNATTETNQFFKDQAEQAKKELDALEEKVQQFRIQNNGRLPDQVDMNGRQLIALQNNYQFLTSSKTRAEMEKLSLETNLRVEKSHKAELTREAPQAAAAAAAVKSDRVLEAEREIRNLEDALSITRQKFTDAHPDVQNLKNRLEIAKNRKQDILKEEAENKTTPTAPVANRQLQMQVMDLDGNIQRLESASRAKDLEIAGLESDIKRVQASINKLDGQINSTPLGEQQYGDLLRERELAKARYIDLNGRLGKAQMSQDLETRGQGEKLELLDAPSLPQYPTEPKRPMVIGIGAGLGLLLGIVIAAAREMKDTSLKNLKDVRAYTQMAILGSVPLLENDFVVRRRKRMAWLGWTTACLMAAVTMSGSVVYYYATKL
ncbi:MAG: Lipopolysaccharide biosynthesis chain length determinant protein [Bryobacterales bacterium]|nr:Lipopolysaccharide biosynthesis chain length determinant protein [Bryobacterales bacterium]